MPQGIEKMAACVALHALQVTCGGHNYQVEGRQRQQLHADDRIAPFRTRKGYACVEKVQANSTLHYPRTFQQLVCRRMVLPVCCVLNLGL